jgi:beta-xylosidase
MARYSPDDSGKSFLAQTGQHFEVSEDQDYIIRKIQRLREILTENGFSPDNLIAVGWNMSLSCRNFLNDSCYRGAYIVRTLISCSEVSNLISHLGITDLLYEHFSPTLQLFGGFGLLSKDGMRKPAYYAFEFMNRLGDLLVSKGTNYIITKDSRGRFFIVCHNCGNLTSDYYDKFHDEADYRDVASLTAQEPLDFILKISGLTSQRYLTKKYSVGENSGSVLDEWMRLGYIESIGRDEIDYLSSISVPRQQSEAIRIQKDTLSVSIHLTANEIQLIQVLPMQD